MDRDIEALNREIGAMDRDFEASSGSHEAGQGARASCATRPSLILACGLLSSGLAGERKE